MYSIAPHILLKLKLTHEGLSYFKPLCYLSKKVKLSFFLSPVSYHCFLITDCQLCLGCLFEMWNVRVANSGNLPRESQQGQFCSSEKVFTGRSWNHFSGQILFKLADNVNNGKKWNSTFLIIFKMKRRKIFASNDFWDFLLVRVF
jgi:hypothetical protein